MVGAGGFGSAGACDRGRHLLFEHIPFEDVQRTSPRLADAPDALHILSVRICRLSRRSRLEFEVWRSSTCQKPAAC